MYDYKTQALNEAIEDTFDTVMAGYEARPEVAEVMDRRDAIIADLLSRHPEESNLLNELRDVVTGYTADYVSVAYVEGVKYGINDYSGAPEPVNPIFRATLSAWQSHSE